MDTPKPQPRNPWRKLSLNQQRLAGVALGLAVAFTFIALNSDDDSPYDPTISAASPSTPPADGGTYTYAQDVLTAAGSTIPCERYTVDTSPANANASAQFTCDGGNIIIRVYETSDGKEVVDDVLALGLAGRNVLGGRNWTVSSKDPALIVAAQTKLGGQKFLLQNP
jgi:hypothetical protein